MIHYYFLSMKNNEMYVYETLKIHTFALMKTISSVIHGWGFSMNFQLCLHGNTAMYETLTFHMYACMNELLYGLYAKSA